MNSQVRGVKKYALFIKPNIAIFMKMVHASKRKNDVMWRGGRAVQGSRLLTCDRVKAIRGFESHPLRNLTY